MKPKLTTIVPAVVFVTAMASLALLSSAANGTEIADFTPTAFVYCPLVVKQPTPTPTPTPTPRPRLQDGYYKFTFDYGSFWFTITGGGTEAINGGYDFQRPYCLRAKRDFTRPAVMRDDGTFYFGASTEEGDPLAYLDVRVILSSSQAHGCVEDYVLGIEGPYYCGYVCGTAIRQ